MLGTELGVEKGGEKEVGKGLGAKLGVEWKGGAWGRVWMVVVGGVDDE